MNALGPLHVLHQPIRYQEDVLRAQICLHEIVKVNECAVSGKFSHPFVVVKFLPTQKQAAAIGRQILYGMCNGDDILFRTSLG